MARHIHIHFRDSRRIRDGRFPFSEKYAELRPFLANPTGKYYEAASAYAKVAYRLRQKADKVRREGNYSKADELETESRNVYAELAGVGENMTTSSTRAFGARDVDLPFRSDLKADWRAEQIGGKWYASGTSVGERMQIKQGSKYDADRYVQKMNAAAREAEEGNAKFVAARAEEARKLREQRTEARGKQGRLFDAARDGGMPTFEGKSGRRYTLAELKADPRTVHVGVASSKGHWHPDVGNFSVP
jgi:hypothetical protein